MYIIFYRRTTWVKVDGNLYKPNAGVIIGIEEDLPIVGKIQDIYVIDGKKVIFSIKQFHTFYEEHYHAYTFQDNTEVITKFISYEQLFLQSPVHIRRSQTLHTYIILPHVLCTL